MRPFDATAAPEQQSPSRLDPRALPRRDFLGLAAVGSAIATFVFATLGILRLPKPAVLPSASRKYRVTIPQSLAPGEPYLPLGRNVALYRDGATVRCVSRVCTHLGCIVTPTSSGFDCPCHGSKFAADGSVIRGPAPKALAWHPVSHLDGDTWIVDEGETLDPRGGTS